MPKPLLNPNKNNSKLTVSLSEEKTTGSADKAEFKKYIRQQRSKAFVDAIRKLDAGSTLDNKQTIEQLVDILRKDFPFLHTYPPAGLVGIVACCYLGENFEVHTLDLIGDIIMHFRSGQTLPGKLEKARGLAMSEHYAFIEVYEDCLCGVRQDGHVSVMDL